MPWEFEDYPTKIWTNPNAGDKSVAFGAGIIYWYTMVGHGETPRKAMEALKENFELYVNNNKDIPRPGRKVPLKFAPCEQMDKYEDIAVGFFEMVLEKNYHEGFYSDGTYLELLEPYDDKAKAQEMRKEVIKRTLSFYKVNITDLYDEPLWKILDRIKNKS